MKKLTVRSKAMGKTLFVHGDSYLAPCEMTTDMVKKAVERLSEYEMTGYEPESLKTMIDKYHVLLGVGHRRMNQLLEIAKMAGGGPGCSEIHSIMRDKKEKRLLRFPVAVGDILYTPFGSDCVIGIEVTEVGGSISDSQHIWFAAGERLFGETDLGRRVFRTQEEAEDLLKEMRNDGISVYGL